MPSLRDRIENFFWRLFWSDYTSWRQDRAFRKWKAAHPDG